MRKPLIVGNWKLNGRRALCRQLAQALSPSADVEVAICPPAVLLPPLAEALAEQDSAVCCGGQDVSLQSSGAFTGEISAAMLAEAGARYGIVGHSERREGFGENDQQVLDKARCLLAVGITPIICVGESLAQRQAGQALSYVTSQLQPLNEWLADSSHSLADLVVAYEPIWAIGTGETASAEQAQEVHQHIRAVLAAQGDSAALRLLYGGSVKADNAAQLLAMADIDGALVGGAALDGEQFAAIIAAAS